MVWSKTKSALCRYCCKSPKLSGDNFPAIRRSDRRAAIFIASVALARSLTSLSSGDEVPHMFTRTSRLWPLEFLISSAKRLLQQNRHEPDLLTRNGDFGLLRSSRPNANITTAVAE